MSLLNKKGASRLVLYLPLALSFAFIVRFNIGGLGFNLLDLLLGLAIVSNWRIFTNPQKEKISTTPKVFLSLALSLSALILIFISINALAIGAFKSWFLLPILYSWVLFEKKVKQIPITKALLFSLTISSGYGIFQFVINHEPRLHAWYDSPNFFAMQAVPILLLSLPLVWPKPAPYLRAAWLLSLIAFLATISLGGYLGFLAGLITWFAFPYLSTTWQRGGVLLALGMCGLIPFAIQLESSSTALGTRSESLRGRSQIWATAKILIKEHPFAGIGIRQFAFYYPKTINQVTAKPVESAVPEPHNLFLGWWLNLGLGGALLFLSLYLKTGWHLTAFTDNPPATALLASLLATLIHGSLDTFYFQNDLSLLFWILIILSFQLTYSKPHSPT